MFVAALDGLRERWRLAHASDQAGRALRLC